MTHSIFDPTGGETEHSGSRNLGPSADNISHLPSDMDGEIPANPAAAEDEELAEIQMQPIDQREASDAEKTADTKTEQSLEQKPN